MMFREPQVDASLFFIPSCCVVVLVLISCVAVLVFSAALGTSCVEWMGWLVMLGHWKYGVGVGGPWFWEYVGVWGTWVLEYVGVF